MKAALVTGGNRGLGLETCRQLAEQGYRIWLGARDLREGTAAAQSLKGDVRPLSLDVERPESVAAMVELLGKEPIDALVNNAGASFSGFDAEIARRTIDVNYQGARRVTEALLPLLAPAANVVMVSSGMGTLDHLSPELARRFTRPDLDLPGLDALAAEFVALVEQSGPLGGFPSNAYSVSKVALNTYARLVSPTLAGRGVKVNAVCPGWVRTRMGGRAAGRGVAQGARGITWAATLGDTGPSGGFFRDGSSIDW